MANTPGQEKDTRVLQGETMARSRLNTELSKFTFIIAFSLFISAKLGIAQGCLLTAV